MASRPVGAAAREEYEEALRARLGAARVFAVSSGRAALVLALRLLGVGPRDDVALPALTCPAVADAVLALGAITHFVDISPRHYGLASHSLRRVLARRRTKAVIAAPLFGIVPPEEEVAAFIAAAGIPWVEDAAQSFGSYYGARPAGGRAPVAALSTNFDKPFTTGRGGALVVNDPGLAGAAERLVGALPDQDTRRAEIILKGLIIGWMMFDPRRYEPFISVDLPFLYAAEEGDAYDLGGLLGQEGEVAATRARAAAARVMPTTKPPWGRRLWRWFFPRSAVPRVGEMARLAPVLCAVGSAHLAALDADGARRRRLAAILDEAFAAEWPGRPPKWGGEGDTPWPVRYPLFLQDADKRPAVVAALAAAGYEAGPFIYPRPLSGEFPYYKLGRYTGRFLRGAWRAATSLLNLPLHAGVSEEDCRRMAETIKR